MEKIVLKPHSHYGNVFAIVKTLTGTYVCPGWHPVPHGTTRDQIEFDMSNYTASVRSTSEVKKSTGIKIYSIEASKPGKFYEVKNDSGRWSCTCPSASFHRGDCKHVKKLKNNL
jgi:hypothetical protein